jgi:hypothetical protein
LFAVLAREIAGQPDGSHYGGEKKEREKHPTRRNVMGMGFGVFLLWLFE